MPRRVYEAPTHTEPIALHSRRIGAIQQPPPKAAPKIIFGSKPPLPKELPRAASSVPAKAVIPRKSPPRARSPIRTQSAFGYKAPPRGLNKAEPRSTSSSRRRSLKQLLQALQLPRLAHAFDRHQEGRRLRHPRRLQGQCRPRSSPSLLTGTEFLTSGSRDHLNPEVIRHLAQFAADYAPINFVVLSFVGRAASEFRRREFQVALAHA